MSCYLANPSAGIVAAGFYKFIKVLEYETANPGQDMDHAAKLENKRQLLVAAGLPHHEATVVANDLMTTPAAAGGMDGGIMANGQGRKSMEGNPDGLYGSNFRNDTVQRRHSDSSSDETAVSSPARRRIPQSQIQRPQAVTTGSSVGRLNYMREAARNASFHSNAGVPTLTEVRLDSPAMATHDEIYAPLNHEPNEALGGSVHPENEPRNRFSRTDSSGV